MKWIDDYSGDRYQAAVKAGLGQSFRLLPKLESVSDPILKVRSRVALPTILRPRSD